MSSPKKPNKNKHGLTRYIPPDVARQVRSECGFGCVLCGNAIFEYEHIDPPFADATEHDATKIGALCGTCHNNVTRGLWSKDLIKEARRNPYCLREGFAHSSFDYGSGHPNVVIGGLTCYRPGAILRVLGQTLLEVREPEVEGGPARISGRFYDSNGILMFRINDNVWYGPAQNWDIDIEGQSITIRTAKRKIALKIVTEPRKRLIIDRLEMNYRDVRVVANTAGVYAGYSDADALYGFKGEMIEPACCVEVVKDKGQQYSCGIQVALPFKGIVRDCSAQACDYGFCLRGEGLVLGLGRNAIRSTGSITRL